MTPSVPKSVVILLSGGQDSVTCLFWALAHGARRVQGLSVAYGQRHAIELAAAEAALECAALAYPSATFEHEIVDVGPVLASTSPLVSGAQLGQYDSAEDLPGGIEPTFIPGRNALFLVLAANHAVAFKAGAIITGVCQEDYGGYPDCRRVFIDAMEQAMTLAMYDDEKAAEFRHEEGHETHHGKMQILTPLMDLSKADSVHLAASLPGCLDALAYSHTCYAGEFPPCEKCHACHLRAKGFDEAGVLDPLVERATG